MQPPKRTSRPAAPGVNITAVRAITDVVPEAATVLLTPVWYGTRRQWRVLLRDAYGRECGNRTAARLAVDVLRKAFPDANWQREQLADLRTGELTEQARPLLPAELNGEQQ